MYGVTYYNGITQGPGVFPSPITKDSRWYTKYVHHVLPHSELSRHTARFNATNVQYPLIDVR